MGAVFQLCHFKSKKPKRHLTACYHESYRPLKNRLPDSSGNAYIDCYSGQMERMLTQSRTEMTPQGFSRYLTDRNREIKGIAISGPETLSESAVKVRVEYVYADRNEAQQLYLEKLPQGWKISRADAAVRVETLVPYGTPVY